MKKWLRRHWKAILVHCAILSSFVLYAFVFAEPLRDWLVAVQGEAQPRSIALPAETDDIIYELGGSVWKDAYVLEGYAYIEGVDSRKSEMFIVLASPARTYVFDSRPTGHTDVGQALDKSDLDPRESDFSSTIPIRKLRSGKYRIGFYIRNGDREALEFTDKALIKKEGKLIMTELPRKMDDTSLLVKPVDIRLPMYSPKTLFENDKLDLEFQDTADIADSRRRVYLMERLEA